ncbi:RNA-binding S4 domain-containing protein [Riemerella anatipestifer]|uniref:Ribosome-associated heat shock protein implicated in the recycling of the 50S subunit (S4-like protein) n=1 Tax=Riemerella anatipestifer RA-CH-1 TaxID=1228997 RepID=J9R2P9_RIEAN|nr:RNA-binding S4 domain-containing protein [Riemerella anatipestifer]AFR36114.1 Ribosome-associated heat shock protein implicated in the recycling of the 50S subunit (S4-like protein) [Riemerella anatipestifer RA-CH-1]AIH03114.1 heat shock protein hsp15 [Riemerella anatipestifer CH3]MCO7332765.1 RNA-binding S4 domain-containing protein [Riemerella anatipestifer]MCO7351655.1 RNA-binding S4 domain-containing protein [Riemerella anatipestifer]MCU7582265.1 RNA-binding S4 domain-containing protein
MRIDKFLWSVRFFKTRSIAAEEIKKNRVSVGEQVVKPSREVMEGDIIKIRKNQIDYKIKVIQIPKSRIGAKLVPLHIKDMTDKEQYEILKMRKLSQDYYRQKGEGRPTKKDRRDMTEFINTDDETFFDEDDWDSFFNDAEDLED